MDQEIAAKISRRTALKKLYFLACAVPVSIAAIPGSSGAQGKVSKAAAGYQDKPKGGQQCSGCIQFVPDNACKIVEGNISPEGWCKLWKGK